MSASVGGPYTGVLNRPDTSPRPSSLRPPPTFLIYTLSTSFSPIIYLIFLFFPIPPSLLFPWLLTLLSSDSIYIQSLSDCPLILMILTFSIHLTLIGEAGSETRRR